ncbi:hypothetical protein CPC08DRAFT_822347 [Agrocybe pediades]|nr:hypothetical protein CPC08DRAFT_822347 [Agrocybe pediades]
MTDLNSLSDSPTLTSSRSRRSSTTKSIRSINSKSYNRQPSWKTSTLGKGHAAPLAASLSVVFAEPEHGAPLASAASTVAEVTTSSSSASLSERSRLPAGIEEDVHGEGTAVGITATNDDVLSNNGTSSSEQETPYGYISPITFPSFPPSSDSLTPQKTSPSSKLAKKRGSWYGSLTRSKGSMTAHDASNVNASQAIDEVNVPLPESQPTSPPPSTGPIRLPSLQVQAPTPQIEHPSIFDSPSSVSDIPIPIASPIPIKKSPPLSIAGVGLGFGSPNSSRSPGKRSWFSSPPTPTPSPPKNIPSTPPPQYPEIVQTSPTSLSRSPEAIKPSAQQESSSAAVDHSNQSSTTVSSVDDSVPSLPHTPPGGQPTSPVVLNTTSSRFMLMLPLLGRTKIPLPLSVGMGGEAVAAPPVEAIPQVKEEQAKETTEVAADEVVPVKVESLGIQDTTTTSSPFVVQAISSSSSQQTSPAAASESKPQASTITSSSSWWDYVGWTSGSSGPAESTARAGSSRDEADAAEAVDETEKQHQEVLAAVAAVQASLAEAEATNVDVKSDPPVPEETQAAVTSSNSSTDNVTSPWLSPWLWYYSSNTTTTTVTTESGSREVLAEAEVQTSSEGAVDAEVQGQGPPEQVENEIMQTGEVKEQGNGENQQLQSRPHSRPKFDEPAYNTITSSIISNTSGWTSFFSSNKLLVKSLGYGTTSSGAIEDVKRDENGMEVMDLDFEDEEPADASPERGRGDAKKDVGSALVSSPPTANIATAERKASGSGTSTPISSLVKAIPRAIPQLMISADVKRDSAAVAGSKSGATSSASSIKSTTTKKVGSGSGTNTPVPAPLSPTPSTSSRHTYKKNAPSTSSVMSSASNATSGTTTTTTNTTTTAAAKVVTTTTNLKRNASPTPSKKSISGSSPPPPNVVLPTWQDIFYTPPRNYLPPKPERYVDDQGIGGSGNGSGSNAGVGGKLLGKTMKFVSNVLFNAKEEPEPPAMAAAATEGSETRTRGKGKERMREMSVSSLGREGSSVSNDMASILEIERRERFKEFGKELPKAWKVLEDAGWDTSYARDEYDSTARRLLRRMSSVATGHPHASKPGAPPAEAVSDVLRGCRRVVVIGVHGWFPGAMIRTVLGEPTGTSTKFANMMEQALEEFVAEHGVSLEKITKIPLEGDGTIEKRVERLYSNLLANEDWMSDLHDADAVIVATHSQGSVVSTHLLDRLISDNHIITSRNQVMPMGMGAESFPASIGLGDSAKRKVQRVCCLALCGIHLGPLRYLSSSTLVGPYLQYFESTAARELFEFQNTDSAVSKAYVKALENVLNHGTKMVYIASLNDQVVPIYSGLFTAVSHPLILRALYIDGDAYHSSDFLSNLLVLLLRILNSGVSDSGLLAHLSEATAGSLNGVGHSTAYEELATFSLAVKYLFLTNDGITEGAKMTLEPFNANHEQNDYEIPWSLRDIIADERVAHFFGAEISALRDAFKEWHPKTSILRDLKRKLQPITRLPSSFSTTGSIVGTSKL